MKIRDYLLEQPFLFRLYQLPFARQKLNQILKHADIENVESVLDVGCGPGTNAPRFANARYLGIDINEKYIETARNRYKREFLVADVTTTKAIPLAAYDFVLVNSFLHHIDTSATLDVLSRLGELLTTDGYLHAVELVLPDRPGLPRWLALHDRGKFPRSLRCWRNIFEDKFRIVVFEPFAVRHFGHSILELVYFKGRKKLLHRS
jgi:SAM-dependent methyltransferase